MNTQPTDLEELSSLTVFDSGAESFLFGEKPREEQTVLLIDDDTDQLLFLENLLLKGDYRTISTSSAQEAVKIAKHKKIDLVICDLQMPKMNGIEFVQKIRSTKDCSLLPVIIITSNPAGMEIEALKTGADMFCEKRAAAKLLLYQVNCLLE